MNQNNELEVFSYLAECVLPTQKIIHNGGNISNTADLIVIDTYDPEAEEIKESIKAHYVITGNHLFLHSTNVDPWNLKAAMEDAGLPVETIKDRRITITKRPGGAKRINSTSGPLQPGDYRDCSLAIRFWPEYPKQALDLSNEDHQDIIHNRLFEIIEREGHVPHATFDAKKSKAAQFVGPTLSVKREGDQIAVSLSGKTIDSTPQIETFLQSSPELQNKFLTYMTTIGVDQIPFKIVHSSANGGVPENTYKRTKFYEAFSEDFGLSSATFRKTVPIK